MARGWVVREKRYLEQLSSAGFINIFTGVRKESPLNEIAG